MNRVKLAIRGAAIAIAAWAAADIVGIAAFGQHLFVGGQIAWLAVAICMAAWTLFMTAD